MVITGKTFVQISTGDFFNYNGFWNCWLKWFTIAHPVKDNSAWIELCDPDMVRNWYMQSANGSGLGFWLKRLKLSKDFMFSFGQTVLLISSWASCSCGLIQFTLALHHCSFLLVVMNGERAIIFVSTVYDEVWGGCMATMYLSLGELRLLHY